MPDTSGGGYELTMLLAMGFRVIVDALNLHLREAGFADVRPVHGFAFQLLSFQAASVNDLAEHLGVTKQAASQMVEYLEQHGYVMRQRQTEDKRGKLIILTEKGWDCIRQTEQIFTALETDWAAHLGTERLQELRLDLRKLIIQTNGGTLPHLLRPVW